MHVKQARILARGAGRWASGIAWGIVVLFGPGCDRSDDGGKGGEAGTPKVTVTIGREPARPTVSLHRAAALGDMTQLESHVYWGTDVNARNDAGARPLELAVLNRHTAAAKLLLEKGAELNILTRGGRTPLQAAVANEDEATMELLLARGAPPGQCTAEEPTPPLEAALGRSSWTIARRLLAAGPAAADASLLSLAIERNAPRDLIVALMEHSLAGRPGSEQLGALLLQAVRASDAGTALALIDRGAPSAARDALNRTPLHLACASSNFDELVPRLIAATPGATPGVTPGRQSAVNQVDDYGRTPLSYACEARRARTVQLLLDAGADVLLADKNGVSPIQHAMGLPVPKELEYLHTPILGNRSPPAELVKALIARGADPKVQGGDGRTPLFLAVEARDPAWVATLLSKGVTVNPKDKGGRTPLHAAALAGDAESASLLLRAGAKANAADAERETPLMLANPYQEGYDAVVTTLLAAKADPHAVDARGRTALHRAAAWRPWVDFAKDDAAVTQRIELGGLLLRQAGLDVNVTDKEGNTALHAAALAEFAPGTQAMIALGVDPSRKNAAGDTAYQIARKKFIGSDDGSSNARTKAIMTLLKNAGAAD
jgi:ankyrin repeat protein